MDGHEFTVGTITYDNYLREPGSGRQYQSYTMHLTVTLSAQGGQEADFAFGFTHYSYGDDDGGVPDTLHAPMPFPGSQTLTFDDVPYTLVICGFPGADDAAPQSIVSGPEGQSTTFEVRGMLVRTDRPDIAIRTVHFQGQKGCPQDGEYIEIVNRSGAMVLIKGWTINAGDTGQNYTFADGGYLGPGMPCGCTPPTNSSHRGGTA